MTLLELLSISMAALIFTITIVICLLIIYLFYILVFGRNE